MVGLRLGDLLLRAVFSILIRRLPGPLIGELDFRTLVGPMVGDLLFWSPATRRIRVLPPGLDIGALVGAMVGGRLFLSPVSRLMRVLPEATEATFVVRGIIDAFWSFVSRLIKAPFRPPPIGALVGALLRPVKVILTLLSRANAGGLEGPIVPTQFGFPLDGITGLALGLSIICLLGLSLVFATWSNAVSDGTTSIESTSIKKFRCGVLVELPMDIITVSMAAKPTMAATAIAALFASDIPFFTVAAAAIFLAPAAVEAPVKMAACTAMGWRAAFVLKTCTILRSLLTWYVQG
jgi:hypothetical protein